MDDLAVPDDPGQEQLEDIQSRFFTYISNNSEAIDKSLTLFFDQVESTIKSSLPHIPVPDYIHFLDEIACHIFRTSSHRDEPAYNELLGSVLKEKKPGAGGRGALDLVSGIHRITRGNYANATELLRKYQYYDPRIGFALAWCYLKMDETLPAAHPNLPEYSTDAGRSKLVESKVRTNGFPDTRPSEMVLHAREQLMELARKQPALVDHQVLNVDEEATLDAIFWRIYAQAREWFPYERWFVDIGLAKAEHDDDGEKFDLLLKEGTEQFPDDISFLRIAFSDALLKESFESAAKILQTMVRVMPDGVEPVYYGLKLALVTRNKQIFYRFRKLAIIRGFPAYLLLLLEYAFLVLQRNDSAAREKRDVFAMQYPGLTYIVRLLAYLEEDAFSGDPAREKRSREALIPIIDSFAMNVLKIRED